MTIPEPRMEPKYDFSKISEAQRNAIKKIEYLQQEIKKLLTERTKRNNNTDSAISHMHQVVLQSTAAILIHWRKKNYG